jgi:hypothetical protein
MGIKRYMDMGGIQPIGGGFTPIPSQGPTPSTQVVNKTGLSHCSNYSLDAFSEPWRCFGMQFGDEVQTLTKNYYDAANDILNILFDQIYTNEIYGKDCMEYYNRINDIHYLLLYMIIIYFKRQQDQYSDIITFEANQYYAEYEIECIRKRFKCHGMEIYPLLEVFNMQTSIEPYQGVGGIGIDIITDNGETNIGKYFHEQQIY